MGGALAGERDSDPDRLADDVVALRHDSGLCAEPSAEYVVDSAEHLVRGCVRIFMDNIREKGSKNGSREAIQAE